VDNRDSADDDAVMSEKLSIGNQTVKQGPQKSATQRADNSDQS
jgi:hypothetical protein